MNESKKNDLRAELANVRTSLGTFAPHLFKRLDEIERMLDLPKDAQKLFGMHVPLGFRMNAIASGTIAHVQLRPQLPVKVHHLWIGRECAPHFDILDGKVGKDSQLVVACSDIPAEAFSVPVCDAEDLDAVENVMRWDWPVAEPGIMLTVVARNNDDACRDLYGVLWARIVEPNYRTY